MSERTAFVLPVRVYWEDTDGAGVVYYANHLRFLERARTEWLRSLGYEQSVLAQRYRVGFVVRSAAIEYLRPVRLDDLLQVKLIVASVGASTVVFAQTIECAEQRAVTADVKIACVNIVSLQPVRIPRDIRAAFDGWVMGNAGE